MSAASPYRWDDPFRTGFAGQYDPSTMYGLIFQAQSGNLQAKHHLAQTGLYDQFGNDVYGANAPGQYHQAVSRWAQSKGLQPFKGPSFQWNSTWNDASSPGWMNAWNNFYTGKAPGGYETTPPPPNAANPPQTVQPDGTVGHGTPSTQPGQLPGGGATTWTQQPEWMDGAYNFGWDWTGSGWRPKPQVQQKGTIVGAEVGWQSGMALPAAYNPAQDTVRFEFGGRQGAETAIHRAIRIANDLVKNGQARSPQRALEFAMAQVSGDAQRAGKTTGWDTAAFRPLQWGERYNETQSYLTGAGDVPPGTQPPNAPPGGGQQPPPPAGNPVTPPVGNTLPPGYAGQNSGNTGSGGGQLTAAQRLALSSDPQQAYRYMMQQIGYNPSAPGLLGNFLRQRFQPLLESRMAASNVNDSSNYMDSIDSVINEFGGGLFQKGGNFFGQLQQTGRNAAQQGAGFLNNLQDQEQAMQYLRQLGMLNYAGTNPMVQQAQADEMRRGMESYQDESFNRELTGQNIDPFVEWLKQQQRYRGIFGY